MGDGVIWNLFTSVRAEHRFIKNDEKFVLCWIGWPKWKIRDKFLFEFYEYLSKWLVYGYLELNGPITSANIEFYFKELNDDGLFTKIFNFSRN